MCKRLHVYVSLSICKRVCSEACAQVFDNANMYMSVCKRVRVGLGLKACGCSFVHIYVNVGVSVR